MLATHNSAPHGENKVLEMIASAQPLAGVLTELALTVEAQSEGMLCSVLLLDKDGLRLRLGAAPSLPEDYNRAIDGATIGPAIGSCGTAAFTGETVIVSDIAQDPLWKDFCQLALKHELRACWSTPIKSSQGAVIGTFAMYYRAPRTPVDGELQIIERARQLAGIAIERHQARIALQESEARYRLLAESTIVGIWHTTLDGYSIYANPAMCAMLEVDGPQSLVGKLHTVFFTPESLEIGRREHLKREKGLTSTYEEVLVTANGKQRNVLVTGAPIFGPDGKLHSRIGAFTDITDQKRAQSDLLQERNLLRTLIDSLPHFVYVKDTQGRYLLHNEANARLKGLKSPEEGLGKTVFDFFPAEIARLYHADDLAVLQTGRPVFNREEPFAGASGERGWLLTNKIPFRDAQGNIIGIVGVSRDITERIRNQAEIKRLANFAAHNPNPVLEFTAHGHVAYQNAATEKMLRFLRKRLLSDILPPDTVALVNRCLAENRNILRVETQIDGRTISWSFFPIPEARVVHCYGGDITERKQAEAERIDLERRLQETQKLESLGVLAGGIAHDFNNLLTGILGNAGLARMVLPAHSEAQRCLDQIEQTSMRAAELCKQMLAYSGKGRFVIQHLDISKLVESTTQLLQMSISKKAVLKYQLTAGLPAIAADATQICQIIMNLVINASDAIGEKSGMITIGTGLMRADADYLDETYPAGDYLKEGDYVYLEVSDNGCGMSAETKARIFEPFFTTKFTGRGLGLAAVLGIIRGHKGALKVYSEPGRGSTFKLLLPCADGPPALLDAIGNITSNWRASGTALVVEDEETVRTVTARMLESFGFQVVMAEDGRAGLEKFREQPDRFQIVVLDLTMPHMDGEETFREIRRLRPDTRVLLMSGFNEQDAAGRFVGKGLAGFIQKPFQPVALREKIQGILAGR